MDVDHEPPRFTIDLDRPDNSKPLPYTVKKVQRPSDKVKLLDVYHKFEIEFFDTITDCAKHIEKIDNVDERIKYSKELNKIFISRHKPSVMRLFRDLINLTLTKKEVSNG